MNRGVFKFFRKKAIGPSNFYDLNDIIISFIHQSVTFEYRLTNFSVDYFCSEFYYEHNAMILTGLKPALPA